MPDYMPIYLQLSKAKQELFNAVKYADDDIADLERILYMQKLNAYTTTLAELSEEFGEDEGVDASVVAWIRMQAAEEAIGISETFAYDLARFLYKLEGDDNLDAKVRVWNDERSRYKNIMMVLKNVLEWSMKAAAFYFVMRKHIEAYAELVPKVPVSCDICKYYVGLGKVTVASVLDVLRSWPPHPNCIHSWKVSRW